ncbi:MAG: Glu/Leu/Phe/Val dehydrogenase dimerization domain-containing protein [Gemmatimonadota bacterium]
MDIFDLMDDEGHEQVIFCHDPRAKLKSIIAIHDTTLGPALGGTRMWPYRNTQEALIDVLRLSEGMTYKASVAGLALGGGKAVILGDPKTEKTEELLRAHGQFVDTLCGRYITAEDVGISVDDMEFVYQETKYVTGIESSPRGSIITITDIEPSKVKKVVDDFGATAVEPEAIYDVECEVFAPCALGAIINDRTVRRLRCQIVAGAANNQLAEDRHGDALDARGILYAPDYVINAGGLINVYSEIVGYDHDTSMQKARRTCAGLGSVHEQ